MFNAANLIYQLPEIICHIENVLAAACQRLSSSVKFNIRIYTTTRTQVNPFVSTEVKGILK